VLRGAEEHEEGTHKNRELFTHCPAAVGPYVPATPMPAIISRMRNHGLRGVYVPGRCPHAPLPPSATARPTCRPEQMRGIRRLLKFVVSSRSTSLPPALFLLLLTGRHGCVRPNGYLPALGFPEAGPTNPSHRRCWPRPGRPHRERCREFWSALSHLVFVPAHRTLCSVGESRENGHAIREGWVVEQGERTGGGEGGSRGRQCKQGSSFSKVRFLEITVPSHVGPLRPPTSPRAAGSTH